MVRRSIPRQLFGTLVAVVAGWSVALLFVESKYALDALSQRQPIDVGLIYGSSIATSWIMAWFIIPVWLLVLIPLYFFIPLSSPLWHWPICTACGGAAGFLVMAAFFLAFTGHDSWSSGVWEFCGIAALVGGGTCFVGSVTRHAFKSDHLGSTL
jgi:hypothetical protein